MKVVVYMARKYAKIHKSKNFASKNLLNKKSPKLENPSIKKTLNHKTQKYENP